MLYFENGRKYLKILALGAMLLGVLEAMIVSFWGSKFCA